MLDHLAGDLGANGLLASEIPSLPVQTSHPVAAAAEVLRDRIRELMDQGLSQTEVARRLGISRQTVSNHMKNLRG